MQKHSKQYSHFWQILIYRYWELVGPKLKLCFTTKSVTASLRFVSLFHSLMYLFTNANLDFLAKYNIKLKIINEGNICINEGTPINEKISFLFLLHFVFLHIYHYIDERKRRKSIKINWNRKEVNKVLFSSNPLCLYQNKTFERSDESIPYQDIVFALGC